MKIDFQFNCCCSSRFKKIYGKFIRGLKKQLGKKKFYDTSIVMSEKIVDYKSIIMYNRKIQKTDAICYACRKRNLPVYKLSDYTITVR